MATTSEILAGAGKLLLGLSAARVIGILCLPILTRIYSTHDFAVLVLYVSVVSFLNPLISLRYPAGIPLPKTEVLALNLAAASMALMIGSVAIVAVIALALDTWLVSFPALKLLDGYIWLVPIGLLFTNLYELFSFWSTRHKAFGVIARSKVSESFSGDLTKILLGLLGLKAFGLLVGQIVSQSAGILIQVRYTLPELRRLRTTITVGRMKNALKHYWQFPTFQLPSQLFAIGAEQAPVLFVAASYQSEQIGNFGLSIAVVALPVTLFAKTLSKSLYAAIAGLGRRRAREVWDVSSRIIKQILIVSVVVGVIAFLFAEPLVPLILGSQWVIAGSVIAWMVPYLVGNLVFTSINSVLNVFHRQDLKLRLDIQRLIVVAALLVWAGKTDLAFAEFVQAYSILLFLHFAFSTGWVFYFLRRLRNAAPQDPLSTDAADAKEERGKR